MNSSKKRNDSKLVIEMNSIINRKKSFESPQPPLKGGTSPSSFGGFEIRRKGKGDLKSPTLSGRITNPPKLKYIVFALLTISLVFTTSCKTKEVPGRRRTPRHCNTCTKWSYVPQETLEFELLHDDKG